ncbi:L,D-transpeptidase [Thermoleophilia bacterium SCSIO 60948]|nr:L,D-transpeptidase [Thermoleophilia bacterium SCSIO 60948]
MRRFFTTGLIVVLAVAALLVNFGPNRGPQPAQAAEGVVAPITTTADLNPAPAAKRIAARAAAERKRRAARRAARREASRHEIVWVRDGQSVELRDAPGGSVITTVDSVTEFGSETAYSVIERKGDWVGVPTHFVANGELAWIRLDDAKVGTSTTSMSIHIDLSEQRAQILDGTRVERSFTVTIGAPDSTTPIGTFSVTDELTSGIDPIYGCCAIAVAAIQPNVPADWSGGNRIAIHGSPENTAGGATSNGCPHATADDLHAMIDALPLGAEVVIEQ